MTGTWRAMQAVVLATRKASISTYHVLWYT